MSRTELRRIEQSLPTCRRCPRLVELRRAVRREHPDYWARPVPGFGDRAARLVVVGLAPGLHGAGRTGRPFQGDASGRWLYGVLERHGLWDGRRLRGVYVVNAVKCVPPRNLPTGAEQARCNPWLVRELGALECARLVLALGGLAQRAVLRAWGVAPLARYPFAHGALHRVAGRPPLLSSYHPSRQNTNTGRLDAAMWARIWRRALALA